MTARQILTIAASPRTLLVGISSVFGGIGSAIVSGNENWLKAFFCLIFVVFAQIAANIAHRYYDHIYSLGENKADGMYNTPTEVPVKVILHEGVLAFTIITVMAGLALAVTTGWWTIIFGAIILGLFIIANVGPHALGRSPWFLLVTFLLFGPVTVFGTELVQSCDRYNMNNIFYEWEIIPDIFMSICVGLMAVNVHLSYGAMTYGTRHTQWCTFCDKHGFKATAIFFFVNGLLICTSATLAPLFTGYTNWLIYLPVPLVMLIYCLFTAYLIYSADPRKRYVAFSTWGMFVFCLFSMIMTFVMKY